MPHENVECIETPNGRVVVRKPPSQRSHSHRHNEIPDDLRAAVQEAVHASARAASAAETAAKAANEAAEAARRAEEILNRKMSPSPSRLPSAIQTLSFVETGSGEMPAVPSHATHITGYFALDGKSKAIPAPTMKPAYEPIPAKVPLPPGNNGGGKNNSQYEQIPHVNLTPSSRF